MTRIYAASHPKLVGFIGLLGGCLGALTAFITSAVVVLVSVFAANSLGAPPAPVWLLLLARFEHLVASCGAGKFRRTFEERLSFAPVTAGTFIRGLLAAFGATLAHALFLGAVWLAAICLGLQLLWVVGIQFAAWWLGSRVEGEVLRYTGRRTQRGTPVITLREAKRFVERSIAAGIRVAWSGLELGSHRLGAHFALVGTPGTGKTLLLRILLGSVLMGRASLFGPKVLRRRAVLYDPKRDMHEIIAGLRVPESQVESLNPFDHRALAWSLATDFDTPALAKQLSLILIPENPRLSDPFWNRAGQVLTETLTCVFYETAVGEWVFNDLVEVLTGNPAHLLHALSHTERGRACVERYLGARRQAVSVLASLDEAISRYSAAAAAMARTPHAFSIREWLSSKRRSVLILGTDPGHSEALEPLNRAFLTRLGQLILDSDIEEPPEDEHVWLAIDELPQLGKVSNLVQLARESRSKGCHVCFTAQSYESLRQAFGPEEAADLLGLCSNIAFTSAESPGTRELVTRLVGSTRTAGTTGEVRTDAAFLDSEFNHFPLPSKKVGIPVLAKVHDSGFWMGIVPPKYVRKHLAPKDERVLGYDRRGPEWSAPLPLVEEDYARLGLRWPPPNSMEEALAAALQGHHEHPLPEDPDEEPLAFEPL